MIGIEKPRIDTAELSADGSYGKFVVEPLEREYHIRQLPSQSSSLITSRLRNHIR